MLQTPDHLGCPPVGSPLYIPNWRYYCRCGLTSLWAKGSAADLLVMLLLTDPSMWPSLFVEMAHCCLILNLLSTILPCKAAFYLVDNPTHSGAWNDCIPDAALFWSSFFLSAHVSSLLFFFQTILQLSSLSTVLSNSVSSMNLLRVNSVLSFRPWIKTLNRWAPLLHDLDATWISCCS